VPRWSSISTRKSRSARLSQPEVVGAPLGPRGLEARAALQEQQQRAIAAVGIGDLAGEHGDALAVGPLVVERHGELVLGQHEPGDRVVVATGRILTLVPPPPEDLFNKPEERFSAG
jgi:hypothetical protein